jgi:HPt (histidine-containing phosphotransfer) domain-containing protein
MSELTIAQEYIYSTLGADADLGELVELFVEEMPHRTAVLRDCWDRADWEGLGRAAHQLKGAAGSYGFEDLTPVLRRLDQSVRDRQPGAEIGEALEEALELCSRIRAGIPE